MGPRKQFFNDQHESETEHADATAYVIYVILVIVFFIFLFVAWSAYKKRKMLQALRQKTPNQQQDPNQAATNANDNEAMQQE